MIRTFENHYIRIQKELEGAWDFTPIENAEAIPHQYPFKITVPGVWEQHPQFLQYRGWGAYKKEIFLNKDTNLRFVFKGISHSGIAYFDNQKICEHTFNAFSEFEGIVKNATYGWHTIIVLVDNSFCEKSTLHIPNDYNTFGGIIRPVILEEINQAYIKRIEFTPRKNGDKWSGNINIYIENICNNSILAELKVEVANQIEERTVELQCGETCVSITKEFDNINVWSHKTPNLYYINAKLYIDNTLSDDLIDRVGFREIKVDGNKILLNDEEIFIQGFNRHEDYGITGTAVPIQIMALDIDLIKNSNSNAVRTSHYPNDERFLDMCDEQGLLVWEENHARAIPFEIMLKKEFSDQCELCNQKMVQAHFNHPSIIIWGILNECSSEKEEGREIYKKQFQQIKLLDSSRPTSFASCKHFCDISLDLPDIVSLNLYPNWYGDNDPKEHYQKIYEWVNSTGGKGKPIIISEFGGAAIYGFREMSRVKWSEERQADIIKDCIRAYKSEDSIKGMFIWQFCDCRVTVEGEWIMTRPRNRNNKGILDEYRRPKLAYEVAKEEFSK